MNRLILLTAAVLLSACTSLPRNHNHLTAIDCALIIVGSLGLSSSVCLPQTPETTETTGE